jgi:trimeric autotransporter adhesin
MNQVFTHQTGALPDTSGKTSRNLLNRGLAPPSTLAWLAGLLCLLLGSVAPAWAGTGIFQTYAIVNANGAGNTYRAGGANADAAVSFAGFNYGSFTSASTLVLNGGEVKTFKNGTGDVTGATIFYRVYKIGSTAPAFQSVNLGFDSNLGGGDQKWASTNANVNLLSSAISSGVTGRYNIEVYWQSPTNEGDRFDSNSGNNYIATFDYTGTTLCGAYTINPAGSGASNFVSFTTAFAALNASGVSCATTFNVAAGTTYTEKVALNTITGASATNTIKFQKSGAGANPKITATGGSTSTTVDAIVSLNGSDYVTFDGIDLADPTTNNTQALQMEMGYAFWRTGTGATANGCQNNVIKNCNVVLQKPLSAAGNTTGIYGANSTNANLTALTATSITAAAPNSNNTFTNNTVENCNRGIVLLGIADASPYTFYDQNNNIGGTTAGTPGVGGTGSGNLLRNLNGIASGSNIYGTLTDYQNNLSVRYNTIDNAAGGTTAIRQVRAMSVENGASGTLTLSNNIFTLNNTGVNTDLRGINIQGPTGLTLTTSNNSFTVAASGSAATYCFNLTTALASWTANANTWNNSSITLATTGSTYFASTDNATPTITFTNNTATNINKSGAGGTFYGYYNFGAPASGTVTITGNTISNITLTGATAFEGIDHRTAIAQTVFIGTAGAGNGNTISNITGGSSSVYGILTDYLSGTSAVTNNTISTLSSSVASGTGLGLYGIYLGTPASSSTNVVTGTATGNTISGLTGTGSAIMAGILVNSGATTINLIQNQISSLTSSNAGVNTTGIRLNGGTTANIDQNVIGGLSNTNTTTGGVYGVLIAGGTTANITRNRLYDFSTPATTATVYGLHATGGTTINASNNMIGDLRATASTSTNAIVGINASANTWNIYYNTIRLAATSSSVTTFGTTGILFGTNAVNIRNNVVVNKSSAGATGGASVALRRSSTGTAGTPPATTNLNAATNNNLYYVTGAANTFVYGEGTTTPLTNAQATTSAYKAFINAGTGRETASQSEDVAFVSATSSLANYFRPNPTTQTLIESGGAAITGLTDDYDATGVRTGYPLAGQVNGGGTAPDMGADEGDFTPKPTTDVGITALTAPTSAQICFSSTETVTVTLKNFAATTLNFATTPVTVSGSVVGPSGTTTLTNVVINTGTLAGGATQSVSFVTTANMTAVGAYTFNITATVTGDADNSNDALPSTPAGTNTRTVQPLAAGTAAVSTTSGCGASVAITLTSTGSTGGTVTWYSDADGYVTPIGTGTPFNTSITTTTSFKSKTVCGASASAFSNTVTTTVSNPTVSTAPTPLTRCGAGSVTLTATSSSGSTPYYYAAASGGAPLGSGASQAVTVTATPASQTFYVAARDNGSSTYVAGLPSGSATYGTFTSSTSADWPLGFNVTQNGTLTSVDVYPQATGTLTISVLTVPSGNPGVAGTTVGSATVTVTAPQVGTKITVPLNLALSAGSYKVTNTVGGIWRYASGAYTGTYPLTTGPVSVVGSYNNASDAVYGSSTSYNGYFNLTYFVGCESARTPIVINVTTPPALTPATSTATICSGSTTAVTYSGYSNLSVAPTTGTSISGNTITFNPTTTTSYVVTGNDGTGPLGCSSTAAVTINVNPSPSAPAVSGTPSYCAGGSTILNVTSGSTIINKVALTENFDSNPATWTVADKSTRSATRPAATLRFQRPPTPYTYSGTGGPTAYSVNGSRFIIATADTGGNGSVIRTRLISPSFSLAGYTTASLTFQQYFVYGAAGDSANVDVSTDGGATWTLNVLQQNSATVGTATTPNNASVNLNTYVGQTNMRIRFRFKSAWQYFWALDNIQVAGNFPEAAVLTISPTTAVTQVGGQFTFSPTSTTPYVIRATYPTSTCYTETPVTITVNPTPTFTYSTTDVLCNGSSTGQITVTPVVGTSPFQYTIDNGATFAGSAGPLTFSSKPAGTYTVFFRDANGCQSASQTVTINEPAALTVTPTTPGVQCHNGTTTVTLVANGGVGPYEYSLNNGTNWFTNGGVFTGVSPNTYFPRVRDANGCTTPGSVSYVVANPALLSGTRSFTAITCHDANDGTITISATGGTGTLTYTVDNGTPQSNNTGSFSGLAPGTYTVTVTDANLCSTTLTSVVLTNPAAVTASISASGATTFCQGGGVNLTATTADSYVWTPGGATTQQINATVSGTYFVTATIGGCTAVSNSIVVTVNPRPTASAAASSTTVCVGGNSTVTFTFTAGTAPFSYQYSINGGAVVSGSTSASSFDVNLNGVTVTTTVALTSLSDANCVSGSTLPTATVTTSATTTWLGTTSDWYDAANWSVCVPSATISAVIPTGTANQPQIASGNAAVNNLDIQGSAVLTVLGTGNLDVNGTFTTATASSYVALAGTTAFVGSGSQPIPAASYFNVSVTGSTAKVLTGDVTINGALDLSGGLIRQAGFDVTMNDTPTSLATITGANLSHFLIQDAAGSELIFTRAGNATNAHGTVVFPIGTAPGKYSPATLVFTSGSTYVEQVHASVTNTIPLGTPADPSGANVVKKTWDVGTASGTLPNGESATLTLEWNSSDNGSTFNVSSNAVSHFVGGIWESGPFSAATNLGNGQLAQTSAPLTSFSPFAIEDNDSPLPVELAAFTAVRKDRDALLRWTTANEKDNRGFAVQVSTTNGKDFRTLTFVNSQNPNSTSPLHYEFIDREAGKSGVRYYRLVQTDLDGTENASDVRTVLFDGKVTTTVSVVPNPFAQAFEVRVDAAVAGNAQLMLIDALGRTVMTQQLPVVAGNNRLTPVLPNGLAAGTYTLLTTVDGQQVRVRLVKE